MDKIIVCLIFLALVLVFFDSQIKLIKLEKRINQVEYELREYIETRYAMQVQNREDVIILQGFIRELKREKNQ